MATLSELDLYLAQGPEAARDEAEYSQLVKIYDALKYIAANFANATAADPTLDALAAFNTNGFLVQTAPDTFAGRTLTAPAAGLTITNPAGTAGNPIFALANDLAALEALASTGIAARTAADTWAQRTITGTANEITLTNGNGVSGNPTVSLPTALTFTGKTITGGTYTSVASLSTLTGSVLANDSLEIHQLGTGDRNAFIDFHSSGLPSANDYSARIIRLPGVNGAFQLLNTGSGAFTYNANTIWHSGNDGAGSGLDADLLDGLSSASFVRTDVDTLMNAGIDVVFRPTSGQNMNTSTGNLAPVEIRNDTLNADAFMAFHSSGDYAFYFGLDATTNDLAVGGWSMGPNKYRVWHANNDGAGSGLDADLLDGLSSSGNGTVITANQILRSDNNSYVYLNYINSNVANSENPTVSQIMVTNGSDNFLRKASIAHVFQQARAPYVIASGSLTGGASTTINVPSGAWKKIELVITNVTDGADFSGYLRINNDSTAGNYRYAYTLTNLNAATNGSAGGSTTATAFNLWSSTSNIESTSNRFSCKFTIFEPTVSTIRKGCLAEAAGTIAAVDGLPYGMISNGAMWLGTAAVTSLVVSWKNTAGASPTGSDTTPDSGTYELLGYL